MCEGKSFHIHAPVTGKARRPTVESLTAGTTRLSVVEDRIKSLLRRDVSSVRELLKVQRSISVQRPISLHGDLEDDCFQHTRNQWRLTSASVMWSERRSRNMSHEF